jgi:F-type H+-transporting ATPase subunit alpha
VQPRYSPIDITEQAIFLYAALNGYLDGIPVSMVSIYEAQLFSFFRNSYFYSPLKHHLRNKLNMGVLDYFLRAFRTSFIETFIKVD